MLRRSFLKYSLNGSILIASSQFPLRALANDPAITKISILHTNDVHSRIDPFPMDGSRNEGLGGAAKRMAMIEQIRAKEKNVLLLDCGDIFQGTPYFNFFGGELEFKLMSKMQYDAATIGNHDFDAGIDGLDRQLKHANFSFINSNYDLRNTVLNGKVKPYKVMEVDGIKIGLFGLGIELKGLVPPTLYKETVYLDPIAKANEYATLLKKDLKCDYVICLSHLGYKYNGEKISDVTVAQNTKNIDLILGGHTHTFMRVADKRRNIEGQQVIINQAGWAGIMLGQIDVYFEKNKKGRCVSCTNKYVS